VLQALLFSLKFRGVLFLGSSESLGDLGSQFSTINERFKFYIKSCEVRIALSNERLFVSDRLGAVMPGPPVTQLEAKRKKPEKTSQLRYVTDDQLTRFVPPCIILDEAGEVLHVYNDVNPYTRKLQPGKFSPDITNIIHEGLSVAVSTALHRCKSQNEDAYYQDVSFEAEIGETQLLDLHVSSVEDPVQHIRYFVIVLERKDEVAIDKQPVVVTYNQATQNRQRILDLEDELKRAQENLQVTVEELETTNEELQSSNEELMVANEELQSTNEELQSVNEELYTVNSEYQEKIAELTRANADLDNMMRSTDLGIVFLDQALLVRSYTEAIQKHINLVVSDIGRPFHHISHTLEYRGLLDDVTKVLSSAEPLQRQVACVGGSQAIVRITPYYTRDGLVQGVVLTLSDVSDVIGLKKRLKDSYEIMQSSIGFLGASSEQPVRILIVEYIKNRFKKYYYFRGGFYKTHPSH
jgi:two-component system CheB/CheR fusion protein